MDEKQNQNIPGSITPSSQPRNSNPEPPQPSPQSQSFPEQRPEPKIFQPTDPNLKTAPAHTPPQPLVNDQQPQATITPPQTPPTPNPATRPNSNTVASAYPDPTNTRMPEPISHPESIDAAKRIMEKPKKKFSFKIPLKFVIPIMVVLLLSVGGYFGYLRFANTPENIWKRGLASVGVGLEKVVEKSFNEELRNTNFSGKLAITKPFDIEATLSGNYTTDGEGLYKFSGKFDKYQPQVETRYFSEDSAYPTIYFKLNGISAYLRDAFGVSLEDFGIKENTWWLVNVEEMLSGELISQSVADDSQNAANNRLSQADYEAVSLAVLNAANEYVFTTDTSKMVLQYTEVLEKEDFEGVESQKYKAVINEENLENFLIQARNNIEDTGVVDKLELDKSLSEYWSDEDIRKDIKVDEEAPDIEVWIDLDKKVLRNVRFSENNDQGKLTYMDVSLLLDDSSKIPLRVRLIEDADSDDYIEFGVTLDTESSKLESYADFDYGSGDYAWVGRLDFSLEGTQEAAKIEVPENAKSFAEVYESLISGYYNTPSNETPSSSSSSVQERAKDTERQTDINALHTQYEVYWNDYGYYPTASEAGDASNFSGLDPETMKSPSGASLQYGSDGGDGNYYYSVFPAGCDNVTTECTAYTLSTTLQGVNNLYEKESLNS